MPAIFTQNITIYCDICNELLDDRKGINKSYYTLSGRQYDREIHKYICWCCTNVDPSPHIPNFRDEEKLMKALGYTIKYCEQ